MKRMKGIYQGALLLTGAALLVVLLWLGGIILLAKAAYPEQDPSQLPLDAISASLTKVGGAYVFDGGQMLDQRNIWAMLIDEAGDVVWSRRKPESLPDHYTLNQVAAFSKWYLSDYPVQCRIREDGLLVLGAPRNSTWKYTVEFSMPMLRAIACWAVVMLILSLLCVTGLSGLLLKHWFQKEQRLRDKARSEWIDGISHDIRTPLSLVMGYASALAHSQILPSDSRKQAGIIVSQSQIIKALVGDLNLTMRLSYQMEPLRKESLDPVALMRQAGADLLNSNPDGNYQLLLDLPETQGETLFADGALLKRAVKNLLDNCVAHNPEGCDIRVGVCKEKFAWVFSVESQGRNPVSQIIPPRSTELGESAHGTGLKLVRQIAKAHGGKAAFSASGSRYTCQMKIPIRTGKKNA